MAKTAHDLKAAVFKALAQPNRLRILELLRTQDEVCNCEIGPRLGLEQSNLSRHLLALSEAGLLIARKQGVRMMYRVTDPRVFALMDHAGEIVKQQLAERAGILEAL